MSTEEITEMVRKSIGVDFLGYNDAENLADAVGMPKDSMCFTCSSGNYDSLGIKPDFTKREQVKEKVWFLWIWCNYSLQNTIIQKLGCKYFIIT